MKIYEFGKQNTQTVILLHGGGLSWWNYREIAKRLEDRFHVVLPVLDGHGESEDAFTSIQMNAKRIIQYVDDHFECHVFAIGGLSLGAQIATEILAQRNSICDFAMIESVSLIPSELTSMLIGPSFSSSYFLIKYNWFSKLQFKSLHINEALYEEYYKDTCRITKQDLISFMKANTSYKLPEHIVDSTAKIQVIVGEKEQRNMKKSAELLCAKVKGSKLLVASGLYHGELSLNYPDQYVKLFMNLIGK